MSATEIPSTPAPGAPPAPPAHPRKAPRLRRFLIGSALVGAGVIVGIAGSGWSQGGPRGWSDDGPGRSWSDRFDGPRWMHRDDGPRGWFGRDDGPRGWFGRGDGPRGMFFRHGGHFGSGQFLTPGRIERIVNRLGWAVDASSEQKQKLTAIVQRMAD